MLLIVDDEPRQRRFIVNSVRELRPQYQIVEARNGREALSMINSYPITSVITDIRMPLLDGLEFVSECKKIKENIMVVFLSAYPDFEYAQKAIRLGAVDYIVKPLNKVKLNAVIEKLEYLQAERTALTQVHIDLKKQLDRAFPVYQEAVLRDFVKGKAEETDEKEIVQMLSQASNHMIIVWKPDMERTVVHSLDKEDFVEICENIRFLLMEYFDQDIECLFFSMKGEPEHFVTILMGNHPMDCGSEDFVKKMEHLLERVYQDYHIQWSAAGAECVGISKKEICSAYMEALRKLDAAFFEGEGHYHHLIRCNHPIVAGQNDASEKRLADAVRRMDQMQAQEAFSEIFQELKGVGDSAQYKDYIWYVILYICKQNQMIFEKNYFSKLSDIWKSKLMNCTTQMAVREVTGLFLDKLFYDMEQYAQIASEEALLDSKQYINSHYMEDLSRDEVAALFHFSSSYFSVVFKKTFGIAFSEYITEVRMENAARMLKNGYDSITTVALKTGYKDVKYFQRVFKKYYRCTPYEYRQKGGPKV